MGKSRCPRVSVITAAYNVDPYIGEAIDSVLAQSYSDFEYLIVNDGSTDSTAEEIGKRVETDARVVLLNEGHRGAASARNVAIRRARGDYIAFLDGDDRWHIDFLREQLAILEAAGSDVAAVFARSRVMSETGRVYFLRWQRSGRYDFDDMLVQSCPPRTGSSLLLKRSAFADTGLFDLRLKSAQDLDMWLRIQRDSQMPYFYGSGKYLVDIRVRPGAISRDHRARFEALDSVVTKYAPRLRRRPAGMGYVRAAVFAYRAGEEEFAQRWARLARQAGMRRLLADSYGRRLLIWSSLSLPQRRTLRRSSVLARLLIGRAIGSAGGILR